MYNPEYTKIFYNAYGEAEWERLEKTAYGRLQAIIHADFIQHYIKPGNKVLDAGSGPGRFCIVAASLGAKVTVLDISDGQLALAKKKLSGDKLLDKVEQFVEADICDLSLFPDSSFDSVICFGGALSYVCEYKEKAIHELGRVTRPGGFILVSVMSRLGSCLLNARIPDMNVLREPNASTLENPGLWQPLKTGDLYGFPSHRTGLVHAPMHLYTADELKTLFGSYRILEMAGSNVTVQAYATLTEQIAADAQAWFTLVELERKVNTDPGLVNSGTHIILVAQKS